jgi:membrane fusion protein (multidrug efflux system)
MGVSQRFVKLGPSVGTDLIILEGLKPGELVATTGSFKLREGATVVIVPPTNGTAATTPTTATSPATDAPPAATSAKNPA